MKVISNIDTDTNQYTGIGNEETTHIEVWVALGLLSSGTYTAYITFTAEGLGSKNGNKQVRFIDYFDSNDSPVLINTYTIPIIITVD